jgi:hypothetical protein
MKKLSILVGALTLTSSLFAQDLTSKKGENYLPEQGDWALGIDAVPFLNYFGNFIGGNGLNAAPNWGYATNNNTIVGKYFVEEKMAYRGALRIGFGSNSNSVMVADRAVDNAGLVFPGQIAMKENKMTESYNAIGLAGGLEWRKGTTRLQGFYGGELGFMMAGGSEKYSYGNGLNADVNEPARVDVDAADDFGTNLVNDTWGNSARVTSAKNSAFGIGLRGFIGVEYFIVPKLSVGGEFGWGLGFMSMNNSNETESIGDVNGVDVVGTQSNEGAKASMFGIDTDINNSVFGNAGQLKITFHF